MQRSIIAPAERVTNLRWGIALLLGMMAIAFQLLFVGANRGADRFGGQIAGAVLVAAIIPAGAVLDRIGVRRVGRFVAAILALLGLLAPWADSFAILYGGLLGLAMVVLIPLFVKATAYWFPRSERGLAIAIPQTAGALAGAAAVPLSQMLPSSSGWTPSPIVVGVACLVNAAAFFWFYRDPAQHPSLTHAEGEYLRSGGAQAEGSAAAGAIWSLLKLPKTWGLLVAAGAGAYEIAAATSVLRNSVSYATLLWLAFGSGALLAGGVLVDALIRRGADPTAVRRTIFSAGLVLGPAATLWGNFGPGTSPALPMIAMACAGTLVNVSAAVPGLVAQRGTVGTLSALATFAGLIGVSAGLLGAASTAAVPLAVFVAVVGILSFVFILGRIEPPKEAA